MKNFIRISEYVVPSKKLFAIHHLPQFGVLKIFKNDGSRQNIKFNENNLSNLKMSIHKIGIENPFCQWNKVLKVGGLWIPQKYVAGVKYQDDIFTIEGQRGKLKQEFDIHISYIDEKKTQIEILNELVVILNRKL